MQWNINVINIIFFSKVEQNQVAVISCMYECLVCWYTIAILSIWLMLYDLIWVAKILQKIALISKNSLIANVIFVNHLNFNCNFFVVNYGLFACRWATFFGILYVFLCSLLYLPKKRFSILFCCLQINFSLMF